MTRPKGSRNKKFTVVEDIEQREITVEMKAAVAPVVEEKFSTVAPLPDAEHVQKILETHTVHPNKETEKIVVDVEKASLPDFLSILPDGEDKDKAIKAAAQAALLLGQSASQVALQYGLHQSVVTRWQDTIITAGAVGRRDRLSDMLMVFIEQELKSLMAISIVTSDEKWIRRQSADQLAHYVAVKSDRLMAMLAAFGRAEETRRRYMEQLKVIEDNA